MADLISMLAAAAGAAAGGGEVDPNFNQTVLLLHGDGTDGSQNNTFLDSGTANSGSGFTITRNPATGPNAPTQGTFSPFSQPDGRWSIFCDGNNQYLTAADSTDFEPGTGDFQINFWVYHTTAAGSLNVYIAHTTNGISLYRNTDGKFAIAQDAVAELAATTNAVPVNQWVYLTALRSSGTIKLYIDAVEEASLPSNTTNFAGSGSIGIGASSNGSNDFFGYISNLQIIKGGSTVPTSVPTSPLTTSVSSGTVSFLSCQSNRFVDNETTPVTLTANGGVKVTPFSPYAPSAAYSTSVNGGSGYFDGTGDFLTAADNAAFAFGTGTLTVEFWYYPLAALTNAGLVDMRETSGSSNGLLIRQGDGSSDGTIITCWLGNPASTTAATQSGLNINAWNHIAVVRDSSNNLQVYVNGSRGSQVLRSIDLTDDKFRFGAFVDASGSPNAINGYASGFRILKGVAQYSGTTLPVPTAPPTSDANTSLLLNFTNAGIFDNTGKNNLETVGNAQIDTTTKKFGTGSMEFDGTGDYLTLPSSTEFGFGSGDFTIEMWLYLNTVSGTQNILDFRNGGTTEVAVTLYMNGASPRLYVNGSDRITGGSLSAGQFYYIALTRSGTDTKLFVDGVQSGSTYTDSNSYLTPRPLRIGTTNDGVVQFPLNGLIDDLRITKGVARTITVPTKAFPDL